MPTRNRMLCLALAGTINAGIWSSGPARADCLAATVWLSHPDGSVTHPIGPNVCVIPTPWPRATTISADRTVTGVPAPAPNGAGVRIGIPLP